ncbi:MAG: glycosyltransferase family 2 protein [Erysipelotrichaceae bacterium]|nr:glycosyltransferase family 2 protein [Erysipelotrichaceae bacterium]
MKILIIIPAYNEADNIVRVTDHLITDYPQYDYVIINDGSTDRTAEICREHGYRLIEHPVNLGLAGAVRTGMKYALAHGYDAAMQYDGDGQHRPEYIAAMAAEIEKGYDIAIGSRFVTEKKDGSLRMLGSRMIERFIRMTTGKTIHDPTSGMRMYNRKIIRVLADNASLTPEPDTVAYLMRCGATVSEVQVIMDERIAGESYLNLRRSIQYMATVCTSILFVGWFHDKLDLRRE